MIYLIKYLYKLPRSLLLITGIALTLLVGFVRFLTGPEFAISLFYIFPIFLVTWYIGKWGGILISVLSAISLLIADLMLLDNFLRTYIPWVNETFRMVVFIFITYILSGLRTALKRIKEISITDPLTGASNRRAFMEQAELEIQRARRFKYPVSVAYIDLDNFKVVNDLFGHDAGDNLLCSVARTIKNSIRDIDIFSRMGGDEFVLMFSKTGDESAHFIVSKLQQELLTVMQKNEWPVTFSIGIATFNKPPYSVFEAIRKSDTIMYTAKHNGKNMIRQEVVNW